MEFQRGRYFQQASPEFNEENRDQWEVILSRSINIRSANGYLNCINSLSLMEVEFQGSKFTWSNNREGEANIMERIDKVLTNVACNNLFKHITLEHLVRVHSDHNPLLILFKSEVDCFPKRFIFQKFWIDHHSFKDVVTQSWINHKRGNAMYNFSQNLKNLKSKLKDWNKRTFGNIFQKVSEAEDEVKKMEVNFATNRSVQNSIELKRAKAILKQSINTEESFWAQKANLKWAKEGDACTKFFHSLVNQRRSKSNIQSIQKANGDIIQSKTDIEEEAVAFFKSLLANSTQSSFLYTSLEHVQQVISIEDQSFLDSIPSLEEVKIAVFDLNGSSCPGVDGFTGTFYTSCWDIIGEDVYKGLLGFFCGEVIPKAISSTLISLIPKKANPANFSDFRPISLCTFFNKVLSKSLASRIANILPKIISPNQSGFVKGRDIIDNVLLAQEFISTLNKKSSGSNMAIKLDMKKAYDKVSWHYLLSVMRKMGFGELWIDRVWRLISNNHISFLVNGLPTVFFAPTNGLRQGDPLSASLFVICSEMLSSNLNNLALRGNWTIFRSPIGAPIVTHLAFADDLIIFSSLKLSCFLWRLLKFRIPLDEAVKSLGIPIVSICPITHIQNHNPIPIKRNSPATPLLQLPPSNTKPSSKQASSPMNYFMLQPQT